MKVENLLEAAPYSIPQQQKEALLLTKLNELTAHHRAACEPYEKLVSVLYPQAAQAEQLEAVPYLPVGLFKTHELRSIPKERVFKTMTSSGTTNQQVSRIFLDNETASAQTSALAQIMRHLLGRERLPMMLLDTSALFKNRLQFNARAAGVLGMMNFGRQHFYALNENMELDLAGLRKFLAQFGGAPFLMFGFTFMAWKYFLQEIRNLGVDLSNGILVHSGGWKKLQDEAVSNEVFKRAFAESTGLRRIYNFYGMVEQVGSIFLEGEDGFLYSSNFGDVIIRDPLTRKAVPMGTPGLIQVLSILPRSYPGHSILTEDLGVIHGVDDSTCGRLGKRFSVLGRVPRSELRGCSDVHAANAAGTDR